VPADPILQRLWRTSLVVCLLMAMGAWLVSGLSAAAGVIGGGALIGLSALALASGLGGFAILFEGGAPAADRRRIARVAALKLAGRYALLGFLAYVMIARLRLHPVGVLAGVSSVAAAAFIEAVRFLTKNRLF
jgi:ATP synthase I subunit